MKIRRPQMLLLAAVLFIALLAFFQYREGFEGIQPFNSNTIYKRGDIVTYNGETYFRSGDDNAFEDLKSVEEITQGDLRHGLTVIGSTGKMTTPSGMGELGVFTMVNVPSKWDSSIYPPNFNYWIREPGKVFIQYVTTGTMKIGDVLATASGKYKRMIQPVPPRPAPGTTTLWNKIPNDSLTKVATPFKAGTSYPIFSKVTFNGSTYLWTAGHAYNPALETMTPDQHRNWLKLDQKIAPDTVQPLTPSAPTPVPILASEKNEKAWAGNAELVELVKADRARTSSGIPIPSNAMPPNPMMPTPPGVAGSVTPMQGSPAPVDATPGTVAPTVVLPVAAGPGTYMLRQVF